MDFSARNHFFLNFLVPVETTRDFEWKKGKIDDLVPRKRINFGVRQLPGSRFPLRRAEGALN
jgi:hypothetical protein